MKIAIFSPYVGFINRGAETFVKEISSRLLNSGHSVTVFSAQKADALTVENRVVTVSLPQWYYVLKKIYTNSRIFRLLADRLHYPVPTTVYQYYFCKSLFAQYSTLLDSYELYYPNNGIWGVRLANKLSSGFGSVIYTGHGGVGVGEQKIISEVDCYICLTPEHLRWASKLKHKNRIVMIPNGVDVCRFKFEKSETRCLGGRQVLCVGAFDDFKRQELLIDAVALLKDVSLLFVGGGDKGDYLRSYAYGLNVDAEFLYVEYEDIPEIYAHSSVFSLPSKSEPFGIVYLEALSTGLNLVVPDDDARRFICQEHAEYVDVENKYEYSKAIEKALKLPQNQQGRKFVAEVYSWEVIAKEYNDLIVELCS